MSAETVNKVIELYSDQLLTFGYLELPKFYQPSSFKERIDTSLVNLIQLCPMLDTLVSSIFLFYSRKNYLIVVHLSFNCLNDF